ncbi:unnamed protein product [Sphenostylis stenocarpa]|uniref:Uncharacterized protein n=1 Tax=Sphenostylis stenocarpa TaxID=92480 RepID=A0AA86SYX4_9FABA|nr:unnamed protein product [Sphenostylis stenocarpa]
MPALKNSLSIVIDVGRFWDTLLCCNNNSCGSSIVGELGHATNNVAVGNFIILLRQMRSMNNDIDFGIEKTLETVSSTILGSVELIKSNKGHNLKHLKDTKNDPNIPLSTTAPAFTRVACH